MTLISNLILSVKDGSTITSTEIYGTDKKTYINIGSGNVFKLVWTTPTLPNETIDRYSLVVKRHDTTLNVYYDIFTKNIGLVNEFYVNSSLLPSAPSQYMLSIYVIAYGKLGSIITSNVVTPYISKGSGAYIKMEAGYIQPIMKRAIAFTKLKLTGTLLDSEGRVLRDENNRILYSADDLLETEATLTDIEGKILQDANGLTYTVSLQSTYKAVSELVDSTGNALVDAEGKSIFATVTRVLESSSGWAVLQEGYTKNADGNWQANDIMYEVLTNDLGEIIRDINNEPIYLL